LIESHASNLTTNTPQLGGFWKQGRSPGPGLQHNLDQATRGGELDAMAQLFGANLLPLKGASISA
jgi:hypothetical protein